MNHANLTISSRIENVKLAGLCAKEIARPSFNEDALNEIELSIVELVTNCIKHAYSGVSDKEISIQMRILKDSLIIETTDNGKVLEPAILDRVNGHFDFDPEDLDNLPESGFGLNIIEASMDKMTYQRLDNKNHWSLTKFFQK